MTSCNFSARVGDVGTVLEVTIVECDVPVDISSATSLEMALADPVGNTSTKIAQFVTDGTDGKIKYTFQSGDLNMEGTWKVQGHVVSPDGEWKTSIETFDVEGNL